MVAHENSGFRPSFLLEFSLKLAELLRLPGMIGSVLASGTAGAFWEVVEAMMLATATLWEKNNDPLNQDTYLDFYIACRLGIFGAG